MSKTASGKKDGRKQERNMVKSKPKDSGMKSMLTVGGKVSRQDQVHVQTIRRLGNQKHQQVQ